VTAARERHGRAAAIRATRSPRENFDIAPLSLGLISTAIAIHLQGKPFYAAMIRP
jgi:hypothetical protein